MATLFETVTSDPFTRAYNSRISAVEKAAAARRKPSATVADEGEAYNPAAKILQASKASVTMPSGDTPVVLSGTPSTGPSRDVGFFEDLTLIPERLRVGAQNLVEGRHNVLSDIYGAENISPYGEDNFLIREPDGQTRLYNQEGWVPTGGDIASVMPEIVGSIAGAFGGAAGGVSGSAVPIVGTIGGTAAGGAAAYTAGKNATSQGISALFGDSNPTSWEQIGWDALDGSTEAIGPLLRAASPAAKSFLSSARTPVKSATAFFARNDDATSKLADITGDFIYDGISGGAGSAARDIILDRAPTMASVSGAGGQRLMGRMAGFSDSVASANDQLAEQLVRDEVDALARANSGVKKISDEIYSMKRPNDPANIAPIKDVYREFADTPNFSGIISEAGDRGNRSLADVTMGMLDDAVKVRGATPLGLNPSKGERARASLLDIIDGQDYDIITKGMLEKNKRKHGFVTGLSPDAARMHEKINEAYNLANPELGIADAVRSPFSKALNDKIDLGSVNWREAMLDAQDIAAKRAADAVIDYVPDTSLNGLRDIMRLQAARVAEDDTHNLAKAISGKTAGPGGWMARLATMAFHPVEGSIALGGSIVGPRMVGKAMRGTRGVEAMVRAGEKKRMLNSAAKITGRNGTRGLSALPGLRAYDPAFRRNVLRQNALQQTRTDAFADLIPDAPFNPLAAANELPSIGTLGARSIDDYIQGLKEAYISESLGRGAGKYIAEDGRSQERKNKGAFD